MVSFLVRVLLLLCFFRGASLSGSLSISNLDLFDGGNDRGGEEIQGFHLGPIGQTDNRLVTTHRHQLGEIGDGGSRGPPPLPAILCRMNPLNAAVLHSPIRAPSEL